MRTLNEWLDSIPDKGGIHSISEWVNYQDAEIYMRFLDWNERTITLANIGRKSRIWNVKDDPKVKSTGFMDRLLDKIENRASELGAKMVIESVQNPFLPRYLLNHGYSVNGFDYTKEI